MVALVVRRAIYFRIFLLIGAALFAIYHWRNPAVNSDTSRRIELTNDDIRQLEISWTAQWQRPPTPEEMRNLVEDKVRQEILYREGLALGLIEATRS